MAVPHDRKAQGMRIYKELIISLGVVRAAAPIVWSFLLVGVRVST